MNNFYFEHKDDRKKERVTFRLEKSLLNKLNNEKRPASEIIRTALNNFFSGKKGSN